MGVVRVLALLVLPVAFFMFGLAAGMFVDGLQQSREEYALPNIESPTGLLPYDRVAREDVKVFGDHVEISIPGVRWASFTPTGSMLPVLGETAHALQLIPRTPEDIKLGDIVSYHVGDKVISHRVLEIGEDEEGTFFITKGDNNDQEDPLLVRFEQIDRVVIGILY